MLQYFNKTVKFASVNLLCFSNYPFAMQRLKENLKKFVMINKLWDTAVMRGDIELMGSLSPHPLCKGKPCPLELKIAKLLLVKGYVSTMDHLLENSYEIWLLQLTYLLQVGITDFIFQHFPQQ